MGTIYVTNEMFTTTKHIFVVVGKETKEMINVAPELLNEILFKLVEKYDCNEIKIKGIPVFCKKLQNEISTSMLSKFDKKNIKVSITM